jgi:diaminopimelate epimerase
MQDVSAISSNDSYHILDTGSPHYVALRPGLDALDMNLEGSKIRHTPPFDASGINVNFAEKINENTFSIRTYERGVEGETLSCGTGATAVAIAMHHSKQTQSKSIALETQGGVLQVRFEPLSSSYSDVWLCGPTKQVFKGDLEW